MMSEGEPRLRLAEDEHPDDKIQIPGATQAPAGTDKKAHAPTFLVQVRKKVSGNWLEVATVDRQGAASTVGKSFLGANSAQAYRVLMVVEEDSR
jgi:hypothetical protein